VSALITYFSNLKLLRQIEQLDISIEKFISVMDIEFCTKCNPYYFLTLLLYVHGYNLLYSLHIHVYIIKIISYAKIRHPIFL